MKMTILILVAFIALHACNTTNEKTIEKAEEPKAKIVISSETELSFNFSAQVENNGSIVSGSTNLPDSTKIGINLIRGNKIFAQDFDVYVTNGSFSKNFPIIPYFDIESVEINLFDNEFWQKKIISKQLQLVSSDLWIKDDFGRSITFNKVIRKVNNIKPEEIINAPQNYSPKGKIEGKIINVSQGDVKRYKVNIDFNNEISGEELDKEIRYWIYFVFKQDKEANAIAVNCYEKGNKMSFMNGYFAPYGEWSNANSSKSYSNHKVKISYF